MTKMFVKMLTFQFQVKYCIICRALLQCNWTAPTKTIYVFYTNKFKQISFQISHKCLLLLLILQLISLFYPHILFLHNKYNMTSLYINKIQIKQIKHQWGEKMSWHLSRLIYQRNKNCVDDVYPMFLAISPFHWKLLMHKLNIMKITFCVIQFLINKSPQNFAHVMTAVLSWHVQNFEVTT